MVNVYILDFGNRIKIGRTKNISQRIKTIENSAGEKIKQVFFLETDAVKEKILHSYLQEYRTIGEFFTCSFEIAKTAFQNIVDEQAKNLISTGVKKRKSHAIIKHNYLTRNARYNLSAQEHKIILYLISKIKTTDTNFQICEFIIKDFCKLLSIYEDNGGNYIALKKSVASLYDKNLSIKSNNGTDCMLKWIEQPILNKNSGTIYIRLNSALLPYLSEFAEKAASYNLQSLLKMKSKYSIKLYELIKSYENLGKCEFEIDKLKILLGAEKYVDGNDFRNILDTATREINDYSDISVSYELEKQGRKFYKVKFTIKPNDIDDNIRKWRNIEKALE
jgi:plasmid replication initiation protein